MEPDGLFVDKRKLKRRHLIYYLRVFDNNTNELLGHLVNITREGLMMISENQIEIKNEYKLRMVLPQGILSKDVLIFMATSVWCKKDVNPDFYATGCQIKDIPLEDIRIVEGLIQHHGFND